MSNLVLMNILDSDTIRIYWPSAIVNDPDHVRRIQTCSNRGTGLGDAPILKALPRWHSSVQATVGR